MTDLTFDNASMTPLDPEGSKVILFEMLEEAGVKLLLHTMCVDAVTRERKVTTVIVENKSGRAAICPKVVIDCTGDGDVAAGTVRAVLSGVLDIPFAPSRFNAGKMLPARDNDGAIRIYEMGNLPFTEDIKEFHRAKIAERAKAEKRNASFQMVIDDVYAISKGRLVGRPQGLKNS